MKLEMNKVQLIKCNVKMAKGKGVPVVFAGIPYVGTGRAYRIKGQGILLKKVLGICSICGRTLSDPNSIKLGIGPICANNMGIDTLSGYTSEDIGKELVKIKIDDWFPATCVKQIDSEGVELPNIEAPVQEKKEKKKKSGKMVEIEGMNLNIYFPFDYETLARVKALPQRKYTKTPKPHWVAPDSKMARNMLKDAGFDVPEWVDKEKTKLSVSPLLQKSLFPYQVEGMNFINDNDGRALIGDEMGLGKTIQSIAYADSNPDIFLTVVVCPASLKDNWVNEIKKWTADTHISVAYGRNTDTGMRHDRTGFRKIFMVINYDILTSWQEFFKGQPVDCLIADECHFVKNYKTKRTEALQNISKGVERFIALSGTPITNRPKEFFTTLNILRPELFGSFFHYAQEYCNATKTRYGWDMDGSSNERGLNALVENVMIRRLKNKVLPDLPEKVTQIVPLEITNRAEYDKASYNLISYLKGIGDLDGAKSARKAEQLVRVEKLKQLTVQGKMKAVVKWIEDYLNVEDKLVVFTSHQETLDFLESVFRGICVCVDGRTTVTGRQAIVDTFQEDPDIKLFIGNVKAAGVGLNLTAANATAHVEFGWNPATQDQASDRVHRIGQERDSVFTYLLMAIGTIDEYNLELIEEKRTIINKIVNNEGQKDVNVLLKADEVTFANFLRKLVGGK